MKAMRKDPMKAARETITFAAIFTLIVTGPATFIAGIILIAVSHSEWLTSIVFVSIFVADLFGIFCWSRRRSAPPLEEQQMTLDAWIKQFSGETTTTSQFR